MVTMTWQGILCDRSLYHLLYTPDFDPNALGIMNISTQHFQVTGLIPSTRYHLAIRGRYNINLGPNRPLFATTLPPSSKLSE